MNPFNQVNQLVIDSNALRERYIGSDKTAQIKAEIQSKVEDKTLQIMLYGAYNAGKSSLINVLLGSKQAIEGDIPTTDKIDFYKWNGLNVVDTPGVNAPIEHEMVTEEQVKRSNILLFVIREGDTDSKDLYERLFDLINRGKKIFIVLNHQASSNADIKTSHQKILQILTRFAEQKNVSRELVADIAIYPINLKTAFTAIHKSSEKLLVHSGYSAFIKAFNQWVVQYDNEHGYLSALQQQIEEVWFKPLISAIENESGHNTNKELELLNDQVRTLQNEKRLLRQDASNFIRQEVNSVKHQVSDALKSCQSSAELDSHLQQVFLPSINNIGNWLSKEIDSIDEKLFVTVTGKQNITNGAVEKGDNISDVIYEKTKDFFTNEDVLKEGLLYGRRLKIPGLKGKWGSTLGKYAGKAAVVLQVVTCLYDAYKAGEAQDEQNNQRKDQALEIHQAVEQICISVISDLDKVITEKILACFDEKIMLLSAIINDKKDDLDTLSKDLQVAHDMLSRLKGITF